MPDTPAPASPGSAPATPSAAPPAAAPPVPKAAPASKGLDRRKQMILVAVGALIPVAIVVVSFLRRRSRAHLNPQAQARAAARPAQGSSPRKPPLPGPAAAASKAPPPAAKTPAAAKEAPAQAAASQASSGPATGASPAARLAVLKKPGAPLAKPFEPEVKTEERPLEDVCSAEIGILCYGVRRNRLESCLRSHDDALRKDCRAALEDDEP